MNYQHILNLSESWFDPFGTGVSPARSFRFPGGERHVDVSNIPENAKSVLLTSRLPDADAVMTVLLAADALKRRGVKKIGLYAPYFPYARQDRVAVKGDPLSISVMARLINSCGFHDVFVLDAHSPVTLALVDNVRELNWLNWAAMVSNDIEELNPRSPADAPVFVAPDAGAGKKIESLARRQLASFMACRKYRDSQSGALSVFADNTYQGRQIIVVDDICDGGATFIDIAKQFEGNHLHLLVTHGIFSKGLGPLFDAGYESIHTSNSWGNSIIAFPDFHVHAVPTETA